MTEKEKYINTLIKIVDRHYEKSLKGIPTCDIGDVYDWIEEAKEKTKKKKWV